jgi:hypothetical protein
VEVEGKAATIGVRGWEGMGFCVARLAEIENVNRAGEGLNMARYYGITNCLLRKDAAAAKESEDQGCGIRPTGSFARAVVPLAEKCSSLPATFPFPSTFSTPR